MSIVAWSDECVLVDHNRLLKETYADCRDVRRCEGAEHGRVHLTTRDLLFDIRTQFKMDSEAVAVVSKELDSDPRKRKRKRRKAEQAVNYYHQDIEAILKIALRKLQKLGCEKDHFASCPTLDDVLINNLPSRAAANLIESQECCLQFHSMLKDGEIVPSDCSHHRLSTDGDVVTHGCEEASVFKCGSKSLVLPPQSSFLCSDIGADAQPVNFGKTFDVVVIDPPWTNKSVKRTKRYYMVEDAVLKKLPVPALTAPGSLIFVWVTHHISHMRLVKEKLFPMWNAELCAEWHWLKLTTSGETVTSLDCQQKRAYENIFIGCVKGGTRAWDLTNHYVIGSVPSNIHSQKPPLAEILKKIMPEKSRYLELFARNLTPGWTSWGNQVLKFQEIGTQLLYT